MDDVNFQSNNLLTEGSPINGSTARIPFVVQSNVRAPYPKAKRIYTLKDCANLAAMFRWGFSIGVVASAGKILSLGPDQFTLPLAAYTTACVSFIFDLIACPMINLFMRLN